MNHAGFKTNVLVVILVLAATMNSGGAAADDGDFQLLSQWRDGYCHALAMSDTILCAQRGHFVDILAVSSIPMLDPDILGFVAVQPPVTDIEISGTVLYILEMELGKVRIFNISDPSDPDEIATLDINSPFDAEVVGTTLYILSPSTLYAYDVSAPASPDLLGDIDFGSGGREMAVHGDAVYIAPGFQCDDCFYVIDVSDPDDMTSDEIDTATDVDVYSLDVKGDTLVVAGGDPSGAGGIVLYDTSTDPLSPEPFDTLYTGDWHVESITASGSYAYFTPYFEQSEDEGLGALNLATGAIQPITQFECEMYEPCYPEVLKSTDDLLIVGMYRLGFALFDLSRPADPLAAGMSDHGGYTLDVDMERGNAYLVQSAGLRIVDASFLKPYLTERSLYSWVNGLERVSVDGNHAYCVKKEGDVVVFDVSDPDSPTILADDILNYDEIHNVLAIDNTLYTVETSAGSLVRYYDVTDPEYPDPIATTSYDTFYGFRSDMAANDHFLYVADLYSGVISYDFSDISGGMLSPSDELQVTGGVFELELRGSKLVIGTNSSTVQVLSVADPSNLTVLGSVSVPYLQHITWAWDAVYATDAYNTLHKINISDPGNPVILESVSVSPVYSPQPTRLDNDGRYVFMAGKNVGLQMWKPVEGITWRNLGPGGGGAFMCLRIHPDDPNVIFAGSDVGGIFRTLDGGMTWETKNEAIAEPTINPRGNNVNDFAFQGQDTVYAITSAGLFRSTDLGDRFTRVYPTPEIEGTQYWAYAMGAHIFDDADSDRQWAGPGKPQAAGGGDRPHIYMTDNCWETVTPESLYVSPTDLCTTTVYSFFQVDNDTILASTKAGLFRRHPGTNPVKWYRQALEGSGLPTLSLREMVYDSVLDTLFLVVESCAEDYGDEDADWHGGVYKSGDNGYIWIEANGQDSDEDSELEDLNPGFEDPPGSGDGPAPHWDYIYTNILADSIYLTSPGRDGTGYAMTVSMPDQSWGEEGIGFKSEKIDVDHKDVFALRFYIKFEDTGVVGPDTFSVAAGFKMFSDRASGWYGIRAFKDPDTAPSEWTRYETFYPIASDTVEQVEVRFFAFDTSLGVKFSVDDVELVKTQALPRIASTNGRMVEYNDLAVDAEEGGLYTGTWRGTSVFLDGVWRTKNGGGTWERLTWKDNIVGKADGVLHANGTWFIDADEHYESWQHPSVFYGDGYPTRSTDGGSTWQNIVMDSLGLSYWQSRGEIQPVFIYDTAEDPTDPDRVFYGDADNYLNLSEDGGETWYRLGREYYEKDPIAWDDTVSGSGVPSVIVDPESPDTVYCGIFPIAHTNPAETTVFSARKNDGGAVRGVYNDVTKKWDWTALGGQQSLIRGGPIDLALDYDEGGSKTFYAAVYSRGVFKLEDPSDDWKVLIDVDPSTTDGCTASPLPARDTLGVVQMLAWQCEYDDDIDRLYVGFGDFFGRTTGIKRNAGEADWIDHGVWYLESGDTTFSRIEVDASSISDLNYQPFRTMTLGVEDTLLVGMYTSKSQNLDVGDIDLVGSCLVQGEGYKSKPGGLFAVWEDNGTWFAEKRFAQPTVTSIVAGDSDNPQRIYVASSVYGNATNQFAGMYGSEDYGNSWCLLPNNGLSNVHTLQIKHSIHYPAVFYASQSPKCRATT
jgi:hypothetical protein